MVTALVEILSVVSISWACDVENYPLLAFEATKMNTRFKKPSFHEKIQF